MDDKTRGIQQRLRQQFGASMAPGHRFDDIPLVVFDEVAGLPTGGETFVEELIGVLQGRGWRVASVLRSLAARPESADGEGASPRAATRIIVEPERLTISRPVAREEALNAAMDAVRDGYDIIVGQNFGFAIAPRILMTRRVQEGFNLGLPNVIAYVSDSSLDVPIPHFTALDTEAMADFVELTLGLERSASAADAPADTTENSEE